MLISWGKNTEEEETSKAQVLRQEHSCGASLMVRGKNRQELSGEAMLSETQRASGVYGSYSE